MVVNENLAGTDHFSAISPHHKSSILVDTETEEFRVSLDDGDQIIFTIPGYDMLVDGDTAQETEALFMSRSHHGGIALRGSTDEI